MKTPATPLENILINSYKEEMVLYINSHPDEVDELIELAISNKQPYSWRAAWLLCNCMEENDLRVQPHLSFIIKQLNSFADGHQRNLIDLLLKMKINENDKGLLFDACVDIWLNIQKQSSVRYKAFLVIIQLTKHYPELRNEVKSFTDKQFVDSLSPGIRRSVYKLIGKMG